MKSVFTYLLCCIAFSVFAQSDSTQLCITTFYSYEHALERANEITRLDLSSQELTSIPTTIDSFKNLEILRLSDNPISSLPNNLGKLQNLKVLELQNIQIKDIGQLFGVISQLQNLE